MGDFYVLLKYEITFDDVLDFNLHHAFNSPTLKKSLTTQRILIPVIYLGFGLLFTYIKGYKSIWFFLPAFAILSVIMVLLYPRRFKQRIKKSVIKMLKEGENTGIIGDQTLNISSEYILETNEFRETTFKWSSIQKIVKAERSILIYTSPVSAIIIPLRAFDSKEEADEFIRMVENFLKEAKQDHD